MKRGVDMSVADPNVKGRYFSEFPEYHQFLYRELCRLQRKQGGAYYFELFEAAKKHYPSRKGYRGVAFEPKNLLLDFEAEGLVYRTPVKNGPPPKSGGVRATVMYHPVALLTRRWSVFPLLQSSRRYEPDPPPTSLEYVPGLEYRGYLKNGLRCRWYHDPIARRRVDGKVMHRNLVVEDHKVEAVFPVPVTDQIPGVDPPPGFNPKGVIPADDLFRIAVIPFDSIRPYCPNCYISSGRVTKVPMLRHQWEGSANVWLVCICPRCYRAVNRAWIIGFAARRAACDFRQLTSRRFRGRERVDYALREFNLKYRWPPCSVCRATGNMAVLSTMYKPDVLDRRDWYYARCMYCWGYGISRLPYWLEEFVPFIAYQDWTGREDERPFLGPITGNNASPRSAKRGNVRSKAAINAAAREKGLPDVY